MAFAKEIGSLCDDIEPEPFKSSDDSREVILLQFAQVAGEGANTAEGLFITLK